MKVEDGLQWALERLAGAQSVAIDPLRLRAGVVSAALTGTDPYAVLASVCRLIDWHEPVRLAQVDAAHLPLLCHLPAEGWCVVVDVEPRGEFTVSTPRGARMLPAADLSDRCVVVRCDSGAATVLEGAEAAAASAQPTFGERLRSVLRLYRGSVIEASLASGFIGLLALGTSLFSMQVYDRVIPTHAEYTLFVLAAGVTLSILFELCMKFARARVMDHVVTGIDARLSRDVFQRLLQLRIDQLPPSLGSLASQVRAYEQVRAFHTASTLFTLIDFPMALFFLVIVGLLATAEVAAVLVGFGLVALVAGLVIRGRVMKLAAEGATLTNLKTGLLVEAVDGIETIKAGSGGWRFLSRWIAVSQAAMVSDLRLRHASESTGYIGAALQQLSYAAMILAGALVVMQGHMTTGALIACSILSGRILSPILAVPGLLIQHAQAQAAQVGLEKLYALKTDNDGTRRPLAPESLQGSFDLQDVSFAYGENPPAIRVAQLHIEAGERVAILGPIGAGKSTLLRLLSGLYVPQQGRVLIDGLDLGMVSRHVLSRQVGYLQQEHRLFQGTLRENLLIGLPDPGDEVLLKAMRRTGMDRIVSTHPAGLDRPIAEGGKGLSGGQRQLVAFTRLLLARPAVLLLDEPTASMDDEQERRCIRVLAEEAAEGRGLVLVTHKAALLPLVDRVVVVAGSSIVMDGPRDLVLQQLQGRAAPGLQQPGASPQAVSS